MLNRFTHVISCLFVESKKKSQASAIKSFFANVKTKKKAEETGGLYHCQNFFE